MGVDLQCLAWSAGQATGLSHRTRRAPRRTSTRAPLMTDLSSLLRRCLAAAVIVMVSACAPVHVAPVHTAAPVEAENPDDAFGRAVLVPCNTAPRMTAEVSVRGHLRGARFRGRFWVGTDLFTGSLRLESSQDSPPSFVYVASNTFDASSQVRGTHGTLFLPRHNSFVTPERSRVVLETVLGVPLSPEEVLWVLTGCPFGFGLLESRQMRSNVVKVTLIGSHSPLELWAQKDRSSSQWAVREMTGAIPDEPLRWRAMFGERVSHIVREIRLVSEEWNGVGGVFDLRLSLHRVQINPTLDGHTFTPALRAPVSPVSLDSVRRTRRRPDSPLISDPSEAR